MMMQWAPAQRDRVARARMTSRISAMITVLGIAVLLAAGSIKAEAHPLRVRRYAAHRERLAQLDRGRFNRERSDRIQMDRSHFDREHRRGGVLRVHAGEIREQRTSARRLSARRTFERRPSERDRATRLVRTSNAAPSERSATSDVTHEARANALPGPEVYASGVSHPDEDVSLTASDGRAQRSTPLDAPRSETQNAVTAKVEAGPLESSSASLVRTPPADVAGAPLEPSGENPERVSRTDEAQERSRTESRSANRQEITEELEQPLVLPGLYRNGRLVVPRPLKGTREILVHQNMMADDEGLNRIRDDYDLRRMRAAGLLVDIPESASLHLNPELAGDRRCARPWTVHFASDISRAFYARFHEPLQINSAVRTVAYQLKLRRVNGNAAGIDGELASPHLTGQAVDFGKHGMSTQQIAWMRLYLLPLMQAGKLDVEEEFQQACFHISVYRTYSPEGRRRFYFRGEVAQLGDPGVSRKATRVALNR